MIKRPLPCLLRKLLASASPPISQRTNTEYTDGPFQRAGITTRVANFRSLDCIHEKAGLGCDSMVMTVPVRHSGLFTSARGFQRASKRFSAPIAR